MELIELVADLLYRHNCVIIPGFGGFVANFKPAELEHKRLLISPARKRIVFNQSLIENDGLLINGLMASKGIDYTQAEKEVTIFSKFLKDRLIDYKNYEFKNIGSFYQNNEGNLVFVAYNAANFYKKSFGLHDVKVKRLAKVVEADINESNLVTPTRTVEAKPIAVQPIAAKTSKQSHVVELEVETPSLLRDASEGTASKSTPKPMWLQVAAAVMIIAAFGFVLQQLLVSSKTNQPTTAQLIGNQIEVDSKASILPEILSTSETFVEPIETTNDEAVKQELVIEDVTSRVSPEATETVVESKKTSITTAPSNVTPPASNATNLQSRYERAVAKKMVYLIVVAEYSQENEVSALKRKLEYQEYQTFSVSSSRNTSLLCVSKFTNATLADNYLKMVQKYDVRSAFVDTRQE
ncbi:MAG: hypothetical protein ACI83I_002009 [Bacteroidia bacterium]|jgi:hypothetical protein